MTDNSRSSTVVQMMDGRAPNGKFAPGNPGRRPGSKNKISNEALKSVRDMKDDAIQQLREKLLAGDWNALEFVLSRTLPRGRTIELDGVSPDDVTAAMTAGEITTEEAKNIATALAKLAEIGELAELRARLEALEKMVGENDAD